MRAAWYEKRGPAREVLRVGVMPDPTPGAGEVRIRIAASGINPGDIKKREDAFGYGMPYPRVIPHSDGAGVVDAVGEGVEAAWLGRRVWCYGAQSYVRLGPRPSTRSCRPPWPCLCRTASRLIRVLVSGSRLLPHIVVYTWQGRWKAGRCWCREAPGRWGAARCNLPAAQAPSSLRQSAPTPPKKLQGAPARITCCRLVLT